MCGVRCVIDVCVCAVCAAELNLVAWTTTPWTLPTNLALCVHPDMDYVEIRDMKTKRVRDLL